MLQGRRLGKSIDTAVARKLADRLVENVVKYENAMVWLTQLKNRDAYISMQSMNVCVLSLLFGRFLGPQEEESCPLGLGVLLHDIGKMWVPVVMLNNPGRAYRPGRGGAESPTPGVWSYDLQGHDGLPPAVLAIALSHHERYDGRNYPQRVKGNTLNQYPLMVFIIDFHDAVTSDRAYPSLSLHTRRE